ncbi:hypothetical protein JL193_12590 [Polaribacter batillariae]|uniref:Uncharacterized protein n=1 Tax=Polaribacter batillariae TaxID=2808900 RepID=A0ABX7SVT4_9FLAO|nr:hypothetical protein [Polaribacter batillariae]QTD36958.1 hypothetical protein JL193_12590 [Polaribacter batillariae]
MKKQIFIVTLFLVSFYATGQQKNINNYKYIIVPEKLDFLKQADQYQTSSLTKFLLQKNGFDVYLSNENHPEEVTKDRCSALYANIENKSSMFSTKVLIQLKNCFDKVVYTSEIGKSREKDYKKSYQEAIRNAHNSMSELKYEALPETAKRLEINEEKKLPSTSKIEKKPIKVIPSTSTSKKAIESAENVKEVASNILYAQVRENGYQLINTKPEVVFLLLNTNVKEVFVIKDKNGILYKNGTIWVAEYYKNNVLISEEYQVKF